MYLHPESLERRLHEAIENLPADGVTLSEIRDLVGHDGMMVLVVLLTLVFLVPVSIPGVSTVFGGGILLIGVSRLTRRPLWVPERIARRRVSSHRLRGSLMRGLTWLRRLGRLSRPGRLTALSSTGPSMLLTDLAIILAAVLLMAPFGLIPLSNTIPAIALIFFSLGVLHQDGLCIALGHCANVLTIIYFSVLIAGGGVVIVSIARRLFT